MRVRVHMQVRHRIIGDELHRGISGGQRKRVNIGMSGIEGGFVWPTTALRLLHSDSAQHMFVDKT